MATTTHPADAALGGPLFAVAERGLRKAIQGLKRERLSFRPSKAFFWKENRAFSVLPFTNPINFLLFLAHHDNHLKENPYFFLQV
ncbi:MAG: hypothetical protein ACXVJE_18320 [Mucilaginibacter sp.]